MAFPHYTSILRCCDGTSYVWHTKHLDRRQQLHNEGRGPKYTAAKRPVEIVYSESFEALEAANAREKQLERWMH